METTSILIVDDHTLVRETWTYALNKDPRFQVIAACGTGEQAVEMAKQFRPHIVLMDIQLPGMDGIKATELIRKFSPASKIIGVSSHTQPAYARKIMSKGAMGYITKSSGKEELIKAIVEVCNGNKYVCEEIKNIISDQVLNGEDGSYGLNALSQREMEIINLISQGYSSKEIASALFISVKTVEVHRYHILKKLGLKNAASLVHYIHRYKIGTA